MGNGEALHIVDKRANDAQRNALASTSHILGGLLSIAAGIY
jgi:hypothetical protein